MEAGNFARTSRGEWISLCHLVNIFSACVFEIVANKGSRDRLGRKFGQLVFVCTDNSLEIFCTIIVPASICGSSTIWKSFPRIDNGNILVRKAIPRQRGSLNLSGHDVSCLLARTCPNLSLWELKKEKKVFDPFRVILSALNWFATFSKTWRLCWTFYLFLRKFAAAASFELKLDNTFWFDVGDHKWTLWNPFVEIKSSRQGQTRPKSINFKSSSTHINCEKDWFKVELTVSCIPRGSIWTTKTIFISLPHKKFIPTRKCLRAEITRHKNGVHECLMPELSRRLQPPVS